MSKEVDSYSLATCSRCYKHAVQRRTCKYHAVLANGTDKLLISDLVDMVDDVMIVGGVMHIMSGMQDWL